MEITKDIRFIHGIDLEVASQALDDFMNSVDITITDGGREVTTIAVKLANHFSCLNPRLYMSHCGKSGIAIYQTNRSIVCKRIDLPEFTVHRLPEPPTSDDFD